MHQLMMATTAALAVLGPFFVSGSDRGRPPAPFDEKVVLPGKVPPTAKSLAGSWQYSYLLQDAKFEGGEGDLVVGTTLMLREEGTYQLHYHARWNLPRPIPLPGPVSTAGMKGRNVTEEGRFHLSGEVLLLEPSATQYADLENDALVNRELIRNENHTWVVRLDRTRLVLAGRCAAYQVDPVCTTTPLVWFQMKAQLGRRWLGLEPR